MSETRFFRSKGCDTVVGLLRGNSHSLWCCGQPMEELIPNTAEAAGEKHLPQITRRGDRVHVCVGAVTHPMSEDHAIEWVYLQTDKGGQRKCLRPGQPPQVDFALAEEEPIAAYAFCNLHGLWKTDF